MATWQERFSTLWSRSSGAPESQLSPSSVPSSDEGTRFLSEVLEGRDILVAERDPAFIVTAPRGEVERRFDETGTPTLTREAAVRELGRASPSPYLSWLRDEHIGELRGALGLKKYLSMKRSDSMIRGSLRLFKTPIVGAHWFVEPASDSKRDQNVSNWLSEMMFERMSHGWAETLNEVLLMADYGHSIFEKVYQEVDGRLEWRKLAPRHPMDVQEWVFDEHGGPAGVRMMSEKDAKGIFIPISKLLIFTYDIEGGDPRGLSLLRSAYKHWYYKDNLYKIDAIQKERHGIGVPIINLPPNYNDADKAAAEALGRNLRTNERAHVVLPPNWTLEFAQIGGQPVNAMDSIKHHDRAIAMNILMPNIADERASIKEEDQSIFFKSTQYVAYSVADVITRHGFRQLIDMNYQRVGYPKFRARRIGEWNDLRTLSFALRNLTGANIIQPDDELEAEMRREFDLPLKDPDSTRMIATPQGGPKPPAPPRVGQPRQAPSAPVGQPAPTAGTDKSGG